MNLKPLFLLAFLFLSSPVKALPPKLLPDGRVTISVIPSSLERVSHTFQDLPSQATHLALDLAPALTDREILSALSYLPRDLKVLTLETALGMSSRPLPPLFIQGLSALTSLKELHIKLHSYHLTQENIKEFTSLVHLDKIQLHAPLSFHMGEADEFRTLLPVFCVHLPPTLKELGLQGASFAGGKSLRKSLQRLSALTTLTLSSTSFESAPRLTPQSPYFTERDVFDLQKAFANLKCLTLRGISLSLQDLQHIMGIIGPQTESLSLSLGRASFNLGPIATYLNRPGAPLKRLHLKLLGEDPLQGISYVTKNLPPVLSKLDAFSLQCESRDLAAFRGGLEKLKANPSLEKGLAHLYLEIFESKRSAAQQDWVSELFEFLKMGTLKSFHLTLRSDLLLTQLNEYAKKIALREEAPSFAFTKFSHSFKETERPLPLDFLQLVFKSTNLQTLSLILSEKQSWVQSVTQTGSAIPPEAEQADQNNTLQLDQWTEELKNKVLALPSLKELELTYASLSRPMLEEILLKETVTKVSLITPHFVDFNENARFQKSAAYPALEHAHVRKAFSYLKKRFSETSGPEKSLLLKGGSFSDPGIIKIVQDLENQERLEKGAAPSRLKIHIES